MLSGKQRQKEKKEIRIEAYVITVNGMMLKLI